VTSGQVSLDDAVRELWRRYGSGSEGLAEDGFEALVTELAGPQHAAGLRQFFDQAVRGTDDLPLALLLGRFGVSFTRNGAGDAKSVAVSVDGEQLALGANLRTRDGSLELVQVLSNSVAEAAGLAPGDRLVAIDDLRVTQSNVAKRLARYRAGDRVSAHAFRGDELLRVELRLRAEPPSGVELTLDTGADDAAAAGRLAWLGI
jgi:predicted metalloprotease with PDZ domain